MDLVTEAAQICRPNFNVSTEDIQNVIKGHDESFVKKNVLFFNYCTLSKLDIVSITLKVFDSINISLINATVCDSHEPDIVDSHLMFFVFKKVDEEGVNGKANKLIKDYFGNAMKPEQLEHYIENFNQHLKKVRSEYLTNTEDNAASQSATSIKNL